MARKYRRRKRRKNRKKASVSQVKAIVKKEVGKTVETQKMVSYLSYSQIPELLDDSTGTKQGLVLSLTGGCNPQTAQTVLNPQSYTDNQLFTLLPAGSVATSVPSYANNVQQAGEGGQFMTSSSLGTTNAAIGGIYQLEGRQAYLKSWYARLILTNASEFVNTPAPAFVRMLVIETRRPLAGDDLAQQIFLQNHAVAAFNAAVTDEPETVNSYLNREIIKKVYMDRLIKLTGPYGANGEGASSANSYCTKIKVRINKKCRWAYYYATENPAPSRASLSYLGPFLYCILCSNQPNANSHPVIAMNTMLTFNDD